MRQTSYADGYVAIQTESEAIAQRIICILDSLNLKYKTRWGNWNGGDITVQYHDDYDTFFNIKGYWTLPFDGDGEEGYAMNIQHISELSEEDGLSTRDKEFLEYNAWKLNFWYNEFSVRSDYVGEELAILEHKAKTPLSSSSFSVEPVSEMYPCNPYWIMEKGTLMYEDDLDGILKDEYDWEKISEDKKWQLLCQTIESCKSNEDLDYKDAFADIVNSSKLFKEFIIAEKDDGKPTVNPHLRVYDIDYRLSDEDIEEGFVPQKEVILPNNIFWTTELITQYVYEETGTGFADYSLGLDCTVEELEECTTLPDSIKKNMLQLIAKDEPHLIVNEIDYDVDELDIQQAIEDFTVNHPYRVGTWLDEDWGTMSSKEFAEHLCTTNAADKVYKMYQKGEIPASEIMELPYAMELDNTRTWSEEEIEDYISDKTGYCINGFRVTVNMTEEAIKNCNLSSEVKENMLYFKK